ARACPPPSPRTSTAREARLRPRTCFPHGELRPRNLVARRTTRPCHQSPRGGVREAAAPRLLGERSAGFGRAATAARLAVAPGARACRPPRGGRARRREEEGRTSEESGREGGRSPLGAIPRSSCARGPSCSEAVLCGQGPRAPRGAPRGRLGPARANPAGSSPRQGGASSRSTFASLRPHHSPRLTLLGWRGSQKCSGVPRGKYKATARAAHAATIVSRQFAFAGDRTNNWKMGTW
ncbi:unnamed protein product, partial [Prorocentrum cordatum]